MSRTAKARFECITGDAARRCPGQEPTPGILSISAQGTTAVQADRTANSVTASYVEYVRSPGGFGHPVMARIRSPRWTPPERRCLTGCSFRGLGALLGALIGAICAQAFSRRPRPFRRK